jgi:hypothetical protein
MDEVEESKKWMIIFDNYLDLGKKKEWICPYPCQYMLQVLF